MANPEPYLNVHVDEDSEPSRVVAAGEIDAASAALLQERLRDVLGSAPARVDLDLGAVTFIDSSGLRVITGVSREADDVGKSLRISAVSESVRKIFAMTGLEPMLPS